jgi:tight adherence protein B
MSSGIMQLFGTFFLTSMFFGTILTLMNRRRSKLEERLKKFLPKAGTIAAINTKVRKRSLSRLLIVSVGKQFKDTSFARKWELELEHAAIPLKPEEFFALRMLLAGMLSLVVFLIGYPVIFLALAMIIGYFIPLVYLKTRKKKRFKRLVPQLATSLGTMATALRSGYSFMQAMQLVGREVPDPLGPEFDRTLSEINFGMSVEEAFDKLLVRLPNQELELVLTALKIQRSTGGNLAELLETMQETIVERIRLQEELNALTAQGKLSGLIITLLPAGLFFITNFMNPQYFSLMKSHPIGWLMIGTSVIMCFLGWLMIQKIIKIED